jgi:tetratricopeptide (TPR) repeat protein
MNLNSIGIVYNKIGENAKALDYLEQSLTLRLKMGNKRGAALVIYNMATIYYSRDDFENAEKYLTDALEIFEDIGMPSSISYALDGLGNVYYSLGHFDQALESLNRALMMNRELEDRSSEGYTFYNISGVYIEKEEYDDALDNAKKALKIFEELEDKWMTGNVQARIGSIYFEEDEIQTAMEYFQPAVEVLSNLDAKIEVLSALSYLIICKYRIHKQENLNSLVDDLNRRLELVESVDIDTDVYWNLSQIYGIMGDHDRERQFLKIAYDRIQNIAGKITNKADRDQYFTAFRVHRDILGAWAEHKNK